MSRSSASSTTVMAEQQEQQRIKPSSAAAMPELTPRVPPPPPAREPGAVIATSRWRLIKYHILAAILRFFSAITPLYTYHKLKYGFPKGTRVKKTRIPSREKGRSIKAYVYQPAKDNAAYQARLKAGGGKLPVHISMHGSGFVLPVLGSDCDFCAFLANELGIIVIDSDYRKAPVHPFPAALEDVEDVVRFVKGAPESFGYDAARVSLGGFSAGGNLALSAACTLNLAARQSQTNVDGSSSTSSPASPSKSVITAVSTIYPACDLTIPPWMRKPTPQSAYDAGIVLPSWAVRFFHGSYCQRAEHYSDWRASPVSADETLFPPHVFIACGDADKLYEGAHKLVERLQGAGHPDTTFLTLARMSHGFDKMTRRGQPGWDERVRAYQAYADCVRRGIEDESAAE